jgi:uncharacterized protein
MALTRKEIVEEINASFTRHDTDTFLSHCVEEFSWTMVGEKTKTGKTAIREWMSGMEECEPPVFGVTNLIEDGDIVACNGDMTMKDKDGTEAEYSYCDIYRFNGDDKITELTSFVVPKDAKRSIASA